MAWPGGGRYKMMLGWRVERVTSWSAWKLEAPLRGWALHPAWQGAHRTGRAQQGGPQPPGSPQPAPCGAPQTKPISRLLGWWSSPSLVSGCAVAWWRPGRGDGRLPLPPRQALSQGRPCCSRQLGEISAAVGCQFSGWWLGWQGGRKGGHRGEECLNWVGL